MATKVWVRNPDLCIRECVEENMTDLVWDEGLLKKKSIDPVLMAELYYPTTSRFCLLIIKQDEALLVERGDSMARPTETWPVWEYGDDLPILEELMEQELKVVVTQTPLAHTAMGRKFFRMLKELQEEYPDCMLHVHGLYSYRVMFGLGFKSVDIEPRILAKKGRVTLPPGREVTFERAAEMPHWVNLVGMQTSDLKVPRNRCIYNMRSALWAAEHFATDVRFRSKQKVEIDPGAYTDPNWKPPTTARIFTNNTKPEAGDKYACNLCSLSTTCRYFRVGSVCSVPDSEPAELARFFQTRDSDTIIEGLGTLLAGNTRRLEQGVEDEQITGKLDPEVTKLFKHIFDQGVKLAKLVNPALARVPTASFTFNQATIQASTPQQLMAAAVAELEARGVKRENITSEMIEAMMGEPGSLKQKAIDANHRDAV